MKRSFSLFISLTFCSLLLISSSPLSLAQKAPSATGPSGSTTTNSTSTSTSTTTQSSSTSTTDETNRPEARGKQPFYTGEFVDKNPSQSFDSSVFSLEGITNELLPRIANYIATALAAIAVVALVYSGIQFLLAEGEPDEISKATRSAYYVVIGLFLLMFSYVIVYLFLTLFSAGPGTTTVPPTTPNTQTQPTTTLPSSSTGSTPSPSSSPATTTPTPATSTPPSSTSTPVPARPSNPGLDSYPSPL